MQELDQMTPKFSRPGRSLLVALGFGAEAIYALADHDRLFAPGYNLLE